MTACSSVIASPPLPLDVLSACSTNWCTCMRNRIRILKAFSSEIKSQWCFYLSMRSCYGIYVFYNLLWFCFNIVTVGVTFKFIHLERFRLGADEDWENFLVTDKNDKRTVRWRRQEYWFIRNWSGWTFGAAIWQRKLAPCSSFLPSRTQLVEECLLCLSLSRFKRFSPSPVCNVPLILSWWFPPLLEYFLLTMRS